MDHKTIQAILSHSNAGLTINAYIKSVTKSQVSAMDVLNASLEKETTDYPFHDKIIVVTNCGRICLGHQKINFSTVFGQAVGIKSA